MFRMRIIVFLIICVEYTKISLNSAADPSNSSVSCEEHNDEVHVALVCKTTDDQSKSHAFHYQNEDKYTQLRLEILEGHQFQFGETNAFRNSIRLESISITCYQQGDASREFNPSSWCLTQNLLTSNLQNQTGELRAKLFNLPRLRQLAIIGPNFNSTEHMWTLPADLEYLNIGHCQYTEYDLANLRYLKFVNFTRNRLTKLPKLHYPLHSLKQLLLSHNPLNEVTTKDIAKLCSLEVLNLENTSFSNADRYCECERLTMWLGKVSTWMSSQHFASFKVEGMPKCNNDKNIQCKKEEMTLDEATAQREDCIFHKNAKLNVYMWMMTIFLALIFLCFLISCCCARPEVGKHSAPTSSSTTTETPETASTSKTNKPEVK